MKLNRDTMAINLKKMELTELVDHAHKVQSDLVTHKEFSANLPILRGAIQDHYIAVVYAIEQRLEPEQRDAQVQPFLNWLDSYGWQR